MMNMFKKIYQGISDICFGLSFSLLAFTTLLINTDVFLRFFFGKTIPWTTEVSEALILYITFLGTEKVLREDKHVKVDILTSRLSIKHRRILNIISSFIGLIVSLVLLIFGSIVTWNYYRQGIYNPSAAELPLAPIIAVIPFGGILLFLEFLRKMIVNTKEILKKRD